MNKEWLELNAFVWKMWRSSYDEMLESPDDSLEYYFESGRNAAFLKVLIKMNFIANKLKDE